MKSIVITNLTLDLYVEYVKPACLVAGIMELVPANNGDFDYISELVDDAVALDLYHCMTVACFAAHSNDEMTTEAEAKEMLNALKLTVTINKLGTKETLEKVYEALEGILAGLEEEEEEEEEERFSASDEAMHEATVGGIIKRQGGFRERDILAQPHYIRRGTWNEEHKVVEIITKDADQYGYHNGCAVDIVTRRIVG